MNGSTRARAALTASVVAVTTTALALSAPSASAHDDDHGHGNGHFTAGAPGVGDRYYPLAGNGGYDVEHYDITGRYYPGSDVWSATTVIRARATQNLYRFDLDFDGMSIHRLEVNGERAGWVRKGAELVVTPKHKIREGSDIRVRVKYSGVPKEFALPVVGGSLRTGFMATDDGATVAGQPDVAAGWFPVNDHPRDKAAYDFHVTVPRGLGVVANGFLAGRHDRGDQTRWDWHAPEPMASYLATIDIGKWDVTRGRTESGIPYYNAVDPDLLADPVYGPSIRSSLARQGEVLDVLSSSFGPYPFRTVGAIIDDQDDLFFALETQTRPVYSKYFWPDGGDSVLAHELAHQWYGDHVALKQWQDIWLNEGWATYAEWLWGQHEGQFTPQDAFDFYYSEIPETDPFWQFVVGQPPHEDLFGDPVYIRGAMTLQVLRNRVGDDAFFQIAQRWVKQRGGGTGTTGQFIALAERVSGQQLDDLFDAWLFTGSRPTLTTLGARSAATAAAPSPADVAAVRTWDAQFSKRVAHGRY